MKHFKLILIAAIAGMNLTAALTHAGENFKTAQFSNVEESQGQLYPERDLMVPHIIFEHEDYGKSYLEDVAPDKVVLISLQCEGDLHPLDYKGKFKFRDPEIEPEKGLKVAIRNVSDYARSDALVDRDLAKAYTAWKDYKDEGYSEDFKFDKKKKEKDNHLYLERKAPQHKLHYIVYYGDMDEDLLLDAFLENSEAANIATSLEAFEEVVSSGMIESETLEAKLPFDYTYKERSKEDLAINQKITYTQAICGDFEVNDEIKTSTRIYPLGSDEGKRRCFKHMTRRISLNSKDSKSIFGDDDWYRYKHINTDDKPSAASYREFGFLEYEGSLYYHKSSAAVPYRTIDEAYDHCNQYY
ncbi:MAG: hypothetical protein AAFQ41_13260 [Cyanobacteria bacterium J06623_7]